MNDDRKPVGELRADEAPASLCRNCALGKDEAKKQCLSAGPATSIGSLTLTPECMGLAVDVTEYHAGLVVIPWSALAELLAQRSKP